MSVKGETYMIDGEYYAKQVVQGGFGNRNEQVENLAIKHKLSIETKGNKMIIEGRADNMSRFCQEVSMKIK